jgi:hypothetical protein
MTVGKTCRNFIRIDRLACRGDNRFELNEGDRAFNHRYGLADDVTLGTTLKRSGPADRINGRICSSRMAFLAAMTLASMFAVPQIADAQGFRWPWEEPPARPRESVRPPPAPIPAPAQPPASVPGQAGSQWMSRNPICTQLEQRLVVENQKGAQTREALPKIEAEMRQLDQVAQQGQRQLEKADCYEYFLFSKTLRATKQCRDIASGAENAKRRLGDLETQRGQIMGSSGRSYTEEIVKELARNNCGANYQQEASRGSPSGGLGGIWQDESVGGGASGGFGSSNYATYRTVCVRLCDGYYFPISFSTLPSHFQQDAEACQSKCAAPVELYSHPNPGGAMEQAMSLKSQEPYTRLKTAFRYRKEFVQGCSCKEAEYLPPAGTAPLPVSPADRRTETLPWEKTTTTTPR